MNHFLVIVIIAALAIAGCAKRSNEERRPTSSRPKATAFLAANAAASVMGATVYSVAETHSMEPVLYGNTYVLVEPVRIAAVKVGDIILWRKSPVVPPIIHQVYSTNGLRLGVAGVNNFRSDNSDTTFITDADLVGRYVGQIVFDPSTR